MTLMVSKLEGVKYRLGGEGVEKGWAAACCICRIAEGSAASEQCEKEIGTEIMGCI